MAQRLYPRSAGTPAITPAFNGGSIAWENTGVAARYPLSKIQGETSFVDAALARGTGDGSAWDGLLGQWVSPAIAAQSFTTSDQFKAQFRAKENFGSADMRLQIVIWVAKPDGTSRGILYSGDATAATDVHEFATSYTNRTAVPTASPVNFTANVTSVDGDFIVVEVGYRSFTTSSSRTGTVEIGGNSATDLPENETTTAQNNPWIEFSQTISWSSGAVSKQADDTGSGSDAASIANPNPSAADSATGTDGVSVISPFKSAPDSGSGSDTATANARITVADSGFGADDASVDTHTGGSLPLFPNFPGLDSFDGGDGDPLDNFKWQDPNGIGQILSTSMAVASEPPGTAYAVTYIGTDGPVTYDQGAAVTIMDNLPTGFVTGKRDPCRGLIIREGNSGISDEGYQCVIQRGNGTEPGGTSNSGGGTDPTHAYAVIYRADHIAVYTVIAGPVLVDEPVAGLSIVGAIAVGDKIGIYYSVDGNIVGTSPVAEGIDSFFPDLPSWPDALIGPSAWVVSANTPIFDDFVGGDVAVDPTQPSAIDTGSGTDATALHVVEQTGDTGAGTDAASLKTSEISGDSGSGSDGVSISAAETASDTGTGSDAATVPVAVEIIGDSGIGTDGATVPNATPSVSDSGAGTDAATETARPQANDVGSGSDAISNLSAQISVDGEGTGLDSATIGTPVEANDAGVGADTATVPRAAISAADFGFGSEATLLAAISSIADAGSFIDGASVRAAIAASDAAIGTDGASILVSPFSVGENGVGVDGATVAVTQLDLTVDDGGSFSDGIIARSFYSATDFLVGIDFASVIKSLAHAIVRSDPKTEILNTQQERPSLLSAALKNLRMRGK